MSARCLHLAGAFALSLSPGLAGFVRAAQEPAEASTAHAAAPLIKPPIREISPGVLGVGRVRLHPERKTITFPAVLNMNAGIVEYLLVADFGKTHESVLRTDVAPYQIHVAMLLLGAQGAGTNAFPTEPDQPLPGDRVTIETTWITDGRRHRRRGEELVHNRITRTPLSQGPWIYNGSRIVEGAFIAQLDGSIVSVITDPNALVNNPRTGHEDDELWMVRSHGLPAVETPVTVTFQLREPNVPSRSPPGKPPPHGTTNAPSK